MRLKTFLVFALLFASHLTFADNLNAWFVSAGGGVAFPHIDNKIMHVSQGDYYPPDSDIIRKITDQALLSLAAGHVWSTSNPYLPYYSLGLEYTQSSSAKIKGDIWQFSLPNFYDYNFDFKFSRKTTLLVAKADLYNFSGLMPYIMLGIGPSINKTSDYKEQYKEPPPPDIKSPRDNPGFTHSTHTYLSSEVGAGIDYALQDNLWLSAGYRYGYYGRAETGNGTVGFAQSRLSTKLTEDSIVFNLTYLFNLNI